MKKRMKVVVSYAIVVLIVLSLPFVNPAYQKADVTEAGVEKSFQLSDIQKLYPEALSYRANEDKSYNVLSVNDQVIAKFIVSNDFLTSNFGYAGEVNMLIGFRDGITDGTVLLENVESRGYVKRVEKSGLFQKYDRCELSEIPITNPDAVSGATFTSLAVIRAVRESVGAYLSIAAKKREISFLEILKTALFTLVIILSLLSAWKKGVSKYRMTYLLFLIVASGFVLQTMLSITLFDGWIKQGVSLTNSWQTVLLLVFALVMPMFGKNRYYCTFLCPMGALQELVGRLSPVKKHSLRFLKFNFFNISDLYLLFIVVAMFTSLNIDFTDLEPFMAFAITIAPWFMLVFGVLVALSSLFFSRPWCAICPTGCVLNHLSLFKIKENEHKK